ncbi:deaminase domain-containing protein [Kamptonema animale CS-326]|jgi:hypothetical protein|uniref:deaminase domain-containing protein n=1 Tax=Kamptonema animale TaxID=92934 RepID=UPI00232F75D2|nr:deaminase domain-containing protein [Kamptonema animale]MDB9510635.1 deaminase domain-containing protein [Kamptonema animale CS-326]
MEIFNLTDSINRIRQQHNVSGGKNIALAVFQIGNDSDKLIGISGKRSPGGTVEVPTQPFFQTFDVPDGHSRAYDSEYKLLEELASRYGQMPNIKGTVNLYTERPPCASCSSVIDQFRLLFPNIELMVNHGG